MLDVRRENNQLQVRIYGTFDFSLYSDFRKLFKDAAEVRGNVSIDMSDVSYMDSAALGMLLLLEQRVGKVDVRMRLVGSRGQPRDVLELASFGKYFDIT